MKTSAITLCFFILLLAGCASISTTNLKEDNGNRVLSYQTNGSLELHDPQFPLFKTEGMIKEIKGDLLIAETTTYRPKWDPEKRVMVFAIDLESQTFTLQNRN
ncbi:MAG: hypothetical protein ACSHX8_13930 [Opitutaceae bacterium]